MSKAPEHLSQQELESYLWGAAKLLRGLIDAGDYKQYVFPLLFFKRLSDVWDEEYRTALSETADAAYARATADDRFAIPEGAHWADVRGASRDVGRALLNAFRAIEAANPKRLAGIFGNASWTDKAQMPDETLKNLIEHFSQHDLGLTAVPEDELGNAYEYLIKQFADDSGHTAQEFYTNRTLVHLMAQMLEPQTRRAHLRSDCRHRRHAHLLTGRGQAPRRRCAHAWPLRPGTDSHHGRHRPNEPRPPRRRGLRDRRRQHAEQPRASSSATASAPSTWCSPTRRTRSRSGIARRGRAIRGAATSSAPRRRAAPTTHSSSTS